MSEERQPNALLNKNVVADLKQAIKSAKEGQPNAELRERERKFALFLELVELAISELPDRSSPDDWPEAMLVTGPELRLIITAKYDETLASIQAEGRQDYLSLTKVHREFLKQVRKAGVKVDLYSLALQSELVNERAEKAEQQLAEARAQITALRILLTASTEAAIERAADAQKEVPTDSSARQTNAAGSATGATPQQVEGVAPKGSS